MHIETWIEMEIERIKLEDSEEKFQCDGTFIKEHGIGKLEENNGRI
jgi:hypothetical protein